MEQIRLLLAAADMLVLKENGEIKKNGKKNPTRS